MTPTVPRGSATTTTLCSLRGSNGTAITITVSNSSPFAPTGGRFDLLGEPHGQPRARLSQRERQRSSTVTLPVVVDGNGSYIYQGGDYGDIEFPSLTVDESTIDQFLGVPSSTDTMTGGSLPAPSSIKVAVEDGTGVTGQATETARSLATLGFQIAARRQRRSSREQNPETVVYYGSHSEKVVGDALAVTRTLSGSAIMAFDPAQVRSPARRSPSSREATSRCLQRPRPPFSQAPPPQVRLASC